MFWLADASHSILNVFCVLLCQVSDVNAAALVKVVPTPNNGYPELVPLRTLKVRLIQWAHAACSLPELNSGRLFKVDRLCILL